MWSLDRFLTAAHGIIEEDVVKKEETDYVDFSRRAHRNVGLIPYDAADWQKSDLDVSALAMTQNAVIVAHADKVKKIERQEGESRVSFKRKPFFRYDGWKLSALERESGKVIWSVGLPSEPLYNGLAVAADGSVLVTLRDGRLVCVKAR